MTQFVWASVDPVRRKVDIYPKAIALRIEKSYNERDRFGLKSTCVLGSDFFNATVHFHPSGTQYQTTPGMSLGRAGIKQPGYRSVKRCPVLNGTITIYSKPVHGEWRIVNTELESEHTFIETPNTSNIIVSDNLQEPSDFTVWESSDLETDDDNKLVIVWEWCLQTYGDDVSKYSDANWRPYNCDINRLIEEAFTSCLMHIKVDLPVIGERNICFNSENCYAKQESLDKTKIRTVRRVVKTVKELNLVFANIANLPENYSEIVSHLSPDEIPHHYCCPILQEIMSDPVKTVDGFTYERGAIETWFALRISSPLTGLPLDTNLLVPNTELADAISDFIQRVKK
jgi:hypothetical protein